MRRTIVVGVAKFGDGLDVVDGDIWGCVAWVCILGGFWTKGENEIAL